MRMNLELKRGFVITIGVHVIALVVAVCLAWVETLKAEPEPVVFELVAAATPQVDPQSEENAELAELERLQLPESIPLKKIPAIPDIPEPPPPPKTEPKPTPIPEKVEKSEEAPPEKKISFEEWSKNRNLPDRVQKVDKPRKPVPTNLPVIESKVRERLAKQLSPIKLEGLNINSLADSSELQRYLAALQQRIQRSFEPSGSGLQAEAGFTVDSNGRVRDWRIIRSSGDRVFDQSVLRTLQSLQTPGPPPGGRSYPFSLTFKSE